MRNRTLSRTFVKVVGIAAPLVVTAALIAPASVAAQDQALDGLAGLRNSDTDPAIGPLDGFGEFDRAALDYQRRSVGLDLGEVQTVRGFRLMEYDQDGTSRLSQEDYTLWVSDDNVTYTELTGWSFDEVVDGTGHLVHTFSEFETQARYVKVNTRYADTAYTFRADMATGVLAYDTTPPPVDTTPSEPDDSMQVVDKGLVHDAGTDSAFAPAVTRAPNGDILVVFKTTGDVQPGGELRLVRSTDGGQTWGESVLLVEPQHFEDGSMHSSRGNLVTLSDGTIVLTFNEGVNYSPFNNRDSLLFVARSTDNGHTWTGLDEPVQLPDVVEREHWACCSRVTELDDGTLMMSLWGSLELVEDWQVNPMRWRAAVVKSYDGGRTWTDYATIGYDPHIPPGSGGGGSRGGGVNEVSVVELRDGRLMAVLRYEGPVALRAGANPFWLYVSYSGDMGQTWSEPVATEIGAQAIFMAEAPCSASLPEGQTKVMLGHRIMSTAGRAPTADEPYADLAGVSVSFDGGSTWRNRTVLEHPEDLPFNAFRAANTDFVQLDDTHVFTVFQYQDGKVGPYKLAFNVLEDGSGDECVQEWQRAQQDAESTLSLHIQRADLTNWPYRLARTQVHLDPDTPVDELIQQAAETMTCRPDQARLSVRRDGADQPLDPGQTLAEAGLRTGDVITVTGSEATDATVVTGHVEYDQAPQTRHLYAWSGACDYEFPLDSAARSIGVRVDVPPGQVVESVSLRDVDAESRLTAGDYTLWVSGDNDTYRPLQVEYRYGWVDEDVDPVVGNLAHFGHAGGFALDYRKRSVGVDLGRAVTVSEMVLRDEDESTRLTPEDLSLYVSDENAGDWRLVEGVEVTREPGSFVISGIDQTARYLKVAQPYTDTAFTFTVDRLPQMVEVVTADGGEPRQWSFTEEVVDGRLVHTFSGLSVTEPYLKIHQSYGGGAATFVIGSMRDDVTVTLDACPDGYSPDQTVAFGDQDSGVPNYERDDGCTILDLIWQGAPFPDHSTFVNHVDQVTLAFVGAGLLSDREHGHIMRAAAQSE